MAEALLLADGRQHGEASECVGDSICLGGCGRATQVIASVHLVGRCRVHESVSAL
jgi:hypothetical protein